MNEDVYVTKTHNLNNAYISAEVIFKRREEGPYNISYVNNGFVFKVHRNLRTVDTSSLEKEDKICIASFEEDGHGVVML